MEAFFYTAYCIKNHKFTYQSNIFHLMVKAPELPMLS